MPQFLGPEQESSREKGLESLRVPPQVKVPRTSLGPLGDQVAQTLDGKVTVPGADALKEMLSVTLDSWKPVHDQASRTLGIGNPAMERSYPDGDELISVGNSFYSLHIFRDANDPARFVLPSLRTLDPAYPAVSDERDGEILISKDGKAPVLVLREVRETEDGIGVLEINAGARFARNNETRSQLCLNFQESFSPESSTGSYVRELIEDRLVAQLRKVIREQIQERTSDNTPSTETELRVEDLKRRRRSRPNKDDRFLPTESMILSDLMVRGYATLRAEAPDEPRIYDEFTYYAPLPPMDVFDPPPEPECFQRREYTLDVGSDGELIIATKTADPE